MPKLPGINHQRAVKAFEKAGFWIAREGKHITLAKKLISKCYRTSFSLERYLPFQVGKEDFPGPYFPFIK
jgi:hypothetical protein